MKKLLLIAAFVMPVLAFSQSKKHTQSVKKVVVSDSTKTTNIKHADTVVIGDNDIDEKSDSSKPLQPVQYAIVLNDQDLQVLGYVIDKSEAEHSLVKKVLAFLQQNLRIISPQTEDKQKKK